MDCTRVMPAADIDSRWPKQTRKESKSMDIQFALHVAKNPNGDMARYCEALEFLVDNRADLKQRVYIVLPGGLKPAK